MEEPTRITIEEVVHWLDVGEDFVLVDARSSQSFDASEEAIDGAIRVPPEEVAQNLPDVPTDRPVVAFCTSPAERSSARVARELMQHGFADVRPLLGGLAAWKAAHQPTVQKAREEEPPRASAPSMA